MLQEEVESKSVTLSINTAKLTARELKAALEKYLNHRKTVKLNKVKSKDVIHRGKQTVKQLVHQNQGMTNIEISDKNIKSFDRVARKYGVDYAVKKDRTSEPPKYLVFFKAKDADALTAAFTEYAAKAVKNKESVIAKLQNLAEKFKTIAPKVKNKSRDAR